MSGPFRSAAQCLAIARAIANESNLFFTEQVDTKPDGSRVTVWILYRKHHDGRRERLCRRSSPADLLKAVQNASATASARRAA